MNKKLKYILYFILFLVIIGGTIGTCQYFKPHRNIASATADFSLVSIELYKEFAANEATANTKYLNKIIEVSGIVDNSTLNERGDLSITLKYPGMTSGSVLCSIPSTNLKKARNPVNGQKVKIKGTCSGLSIDDVVLDRCVLVE
jgi:hypothetical protein